jgi:hypothetical protein
MERFGLERMILVMSALTVGLNALMTSGPTLAQSAPSASQSPGGDIELSAAVRQALGNLTFPKVSERLKSIKVGSGVLTYYERLENGLWGVTQVATDSRGNFIQRQVTLSGLIALGGTLQAVTTSELATFFRVPIFLGPVTRAYNGTSQSDNLKGDLATLTNPAPGSQFSYELSMQIHNGSKTSNREIRAFCAAGTSASAATLHPKLRGSFLPVTCEQVRDGAASTIKYAYLIESGLYVATSASYGRDIVFADVEYAEAK